MANSAALVNDLRPKSGFQKFVAKFKLHPFIVTLSTQLIIFGAVSVIFIYKKKNL